MEASQASEAGSIPVARSTPARPRAGRFCYARAGGIARHEGRHAGDIRPEGFMSCKTPTTAGREGARRLQDRAQYRLARKTRTARLLHRHFREKLARHGSSTGTSAKKLAQRAQKRRIWGVLSLLGELFRARHGKFSKSKRSRPLRHIHTVHMKPPAPLLTSGSSLLKPTTPPHTCPSAPPASKDIQERILSDLEAKLRRLNEAESATSEALGRLTDLRNLCMENSLYPREGTIA